LSIPSNKNNWFIDKDSRHRWIYHRIKKHILSVKTKFQQVEFIDTYELGRLVILDNKIQSAEADEFIYHETLVHPAMIAHPDPKIVLILGGGEGATLREVLRHGTVEKVVMVDIDEEFVSLCKKHLRNWHRGSFNDKRVELIFADAKEYISNSTPFFDVIIADISDPFEKGPAQELYTMKFYSDIKKALKTTGIFVTHVTGVFYTSGRYRYMDILKTLNDIFPLTHFYYEYIPSYSSLWGFAACSQKYSPRKISPDTVYKRLKKRNLDSLSYYDKETHTRLFQLPRFLRNFLLNSPFPKGV
jgi:spermidine synthase